MGVKPAMIYGAEVCGLSNSEVLKAQQRYASTLSPYGASASRHRKLLPHGDTLAAEAIAAIGRLAREVWLAQVPQLQN